MHGVTRVDIKEDGFHPAVVYDRWKVAVFNYTPDYDPGAITFLQKHNESDEVFILLQGECTLLISEEARPVGYCGVKMEKGKVYNVGRGVWHSHILTPGTRVIVVENADTVPGNSPKIPIPYPVEQGTLSYREI